ncbi:hypothetical protein [Nocardia colli]
MSPLARVFRWGNRLSATTVPTGPAALWIWSETALLHGQGPTARELLGQP